MDTTWPGRWPRPPLGPASAAPRRAFFGHGEPWLEDLLNDPVTRAVMDRDGVDMAALRQLMDTARQHRRGA
ncbi:MAG: hypothetical protein H6907_15695 [Hyphomicrobiales bacterium]|nr:hypothetical protein [Hyphomicrobiales bacterium]MCP5373170.1 hypothetical protein [Hyphomicrobiales bacterium]